MDGKAESPLESIRRHALVGLPPPRTQVTIARPDHQSIGRVDFYWDGYGVVGEADGRIKYSDDALWLQKRREDELTELGLVVVRWGWAEARAPARLQERIQRALGRASRLRSAGIPIDAVVRP